MAVQAFGWLSSKLGVNIAGRDAESERTKTGVLDTLSNTVFGSPENSEIAAASSNEGNGEVDANGLPVGRDWYYYDHDLKRFSVRPEAPQHIRDEHAQLVANMEARKLQQAAAPLPPPPPPPSGGGVSHAAAPRLPASPQYADSGFFSGQ